MRRESRRVVLLWATSRSLGWPARGTCFVVIAILSSKSDDASQIGSSGTAHIRRHLVRRGHRGALQGSSAGGMRERRGRLAADNRRGLVDELVVLEGFHHEQGEVHAARDVALEDGVAHVSAPHGQALALAL